MAKKALINVWVTMNRLSVALLCATANILFLRICLKARINKWVCVDLNYLEEIRNEDVYQFF